MFGGQGPVAATQDLSAPVESVKTLSGRRFNLLRNAALRPSRSGARGMSSAMTTAKARTTAPRPAKPAPP